MGTLPRLGLGRRRIRDIRPRSWPVSQLPEELPGAEDARITRVQTAFEPTADPERRVPTRREHRRWRQYLADERAEAAVYRDLASRRTGEERDILLALAEAEGRHEAHWLDLLGDYSGKPLRSGVRTRFLGFLARRFGSVFVLALAQRAEGRSPY